MQKNRTNTVTGNKKHLVLITSLILLGLATQTHASEIALTRDSGAVVGDNQKLSNR